MTNATERTQLIKKWALFLILYGAIASFLVSFVLQYMHAQIISPSISMQVLDTPLLLLISFLKNLIPFVGYAVMIYGVLVYPGAAMPLFLANLTSIAVSSACSIAISALDMSDAVFKNNLDLILLNLGINLILYLVTSGLILLFALIVSKRERTTFSTEGKLFSFHRPLHRALLLSTLLGISTTLVTNIVESVIEFSNYGMPRNAEEWITVVTPYAELVVYFLIGYTIMIGVCHKMQKLVKD